MHQFLAAPLRETKRSVVRFASRPFCSSSLAMASDEHLFQSRFYKSCCSCLFLGALHLAGLAPRTEMAMRLH